MSVHKDERIKGNWVVVYKGKKKRGFKSKSEAKIYESKLQLDNDENTCNKYFFDIINEYLDNHKNEVSYATFNKAQGVIRDYIKPNVKNKRISSINEIDCRNFSNIIFEKEISTLHKNYIISIYKSIFKYACEYHKLKNNPSLVLKPFKASYEEKKKKQDKSLIVWDDEEFKRFISSVNHYKYKLLFYTLYYTGMRLGEALALQWIDFNGNYLDVNKSVTPKTEKGTYEIKEPKTPSSVRLISIPKELSTILYEYKDTQINIPGYNENWFIFGNIKPLGRTNIERVKNQAVKDSCVSKITLHGFRHSHASNLISNGMNIVAVSKRLGHSSIEMTLNIYTHLIKKNEIEIDNYLGKSFQGLSKQNKKPE